MKCPLFTEKLAPLHRYERGVIIWNAVVQGDGGWNQASTRQSGTRSGQTDRRDTCGRIHSILCIRFKIRKAKRYSLYHQRKLLDPSNVGIWSLPVRNVGCLDCYMFRRSYGMDKRDRKLERLVTKLPVCWKHFHWPVRWRTRVKRILSYTFYYMMANVNNIFIRTGYFLKQF